MSWTHKGIAIEATESGNFVAEVCGTRTIRVSLPAMRKQIDKSQAATMEPFAAFDFNLRPAFDVVEVIGVMQRDRRQSSKVWKLTFGTSRCVVAKTPASEKLVSEYLRLEKESQASARAFEKRLGKLDAKFHRLKPE